jgi:uncharacterized UBP type Zn finger protein
LNNDNVIYELIGVINHVGNTIKSGHYITYTKKNDKWYEIDDLDVKEVNSDEINKLGNTPYVLLYKIKDKNHNVPNEPFGLMNVTGNACYMNSALQLLFNTEFYNFVLRQGENLKMVQDDIQKYKERKLKELEKKKELEKELEKQKLEKEQLEKEKELEKQKLEKELEKVKPVVIPEKVKYDADLDYFKKVINNIKKLKETTKLEEAINKIDNKILSCIGLAV